MDFDYKKYSLEQLDNWMHDALSSAEASPQEIYDVIKGVVDEQYHYFKNQTSRCYELLALLNGNGKGHLSCKEDDKLPERKNSWNDFWEEKYCPEEYHNKQDKVVKWKLPIEIDGPSGEYFVMFPDDLLEAANLKEGDKIEWFDNGDGSYILKKCKDGLTTHQELMYNGYRYKTYEEAVKDGWTMTADGLWIKEGK